MIFRYIAELFAGLRSLAAYQATHLAEMELAELERFFSLLVAGPLVGLPTVQPMVSLELLAGMEGELEEFLEASMWLDDTLGTIAGSLDVT